MTSGDVAETLGCSRETARRKLRRLDDEDRVASRKAGGRVLWWLADSPERAAKIDPDDPLFAGEAIFASGDPIEEEDIDDVLYGDPEG
ncbi:MAG: hypothetical protein ABEH66_07595 [Halobacteriales archaeon]